jgi:hypothetical protein
MRSRWFTTVLALLIPAIATAGKNTPHDPKKFEAYSSSSYFELASDLKYSERRGIGVLWEQGLKAGRYEARFQDAQGFYFYGEGFTVCQKNPRCADFDLEGGIWISKKTPEDIRVFLVQPPPTAREQQAAGVLIGALIRKDIGKIFIFPRNKNFAAEVVTQVRQRQDAEVPGT